MSRINRQSILCPNCRRLIGIGESACPYCGLSKPGSAWKRYIHLFSACFRPENIVVSIIWANGLMYVISMLLYPMQLGLTANPLNLLSPSGKSLQLLGATGHVPIDRYHRWWTLVSANYLHGGILHIFFNMVALRQIGGLVVQEYGSSRMVVLYTLGGVLGYWTSYLAGVPLTIGASAAVCSLIGAALYYGKSRGGTYGQAVYRQVGGWVMGLFVFGFVIPGINNWAHAGGIGSGILMGFLLGYQEKNKERLVHKGLATACLLITGAVLLWAVVSGVGYRLVS